ncbi:hypothetical protein HMPREF1982_04471 [Clostridiales bacterium oral taxon 876 str. F0540]|nr:hypothetical protein HMPREF1982_04471 [Clostridiales bacterium oral taxon 876 str. F0540]
MSDMFTKDIVSMRITIIKEKKDCYIGKDFSGNKYKLIKDENCKSLKVGEDKYHYVEKVGSSLFYKNILRLLSKNEEHEISKNSKISSLSELGISMSNL